MSAEYLLTRALFVRIEELQTEWDSDMPLYGPHTYCQLILLPELVCMRCEVCRGNAPQQNADAPFRHSTQFSQSTSGGRPCFTNTKGSPRQQGLKSGPCGMEKLCGAPVRRCPDVLARSVGEQTEHFPHY